MIPSDEPISVVRAALDDIRIHQEGLRRLIEAPAYLGRIPLIESLKLLGAVEAALLRSLPR